MTASLAVFLFGLYDLKFFDYYSSLVFLLSILLQHLPAPRLCHTSTCQCCALTGIRFLDAYFGEFPLYCLCDVPLVSV